MITVQAKEYPIPECSLGYTARQIEQLMGSRIHEFYSWMNGQTMAICDGRAFDPEVGSVRDSGCGPHGVVVYSWDAKRFLLGLPVVD